MELDLQRHRIRVESEECDELRAQVAREQAPSENGEAIPSTLCVSQQVNDMIGQTPSEEMYLCTVEEESGDESMFMGTSTGAEDDLDVIQENGVWERRRKTINKKKRMVKLKDKDKVSCSPSFWETTCVYYCAAISGRNWSRHWSLAVLNCARLGSVFWGSTNCGAVSWSTTFGVLWVAFLPGCFFFKKK